MTEVKTPKVERRRAREETIGESEDQFRNAFEKVSIGMALIGTKGQFLHINRTLAEMLGYSQKEMKRKSFRDITHPDDLKSSLTGFKNMLSGDTNFFQTEKRYFHQNGHALWTHLTSFLLRDADGHPLYFIAQIRDITDQKLTQQALQESEMKVREQLYELDHIYSTAPVGLCHMDTDLRYLRINKMLADINGFSVEQHIGRTLREMVPEIADEVEFIYRKVIESGEPALDVLALGATAAEPDKRRYFLASYYPFKLEDGIVRGVSSIVRDVTEKKMAEEALRKSGEQMRLLTDSLPVLISYVDLNQHYIFINKGYENWFGYPREEIIGRHVMEVIGEVGYGLIQGYIETALSGRRVTFELTLPCKDVITRPVTVTYVPQFGDGGKVRGFVAVITDLTEVKRLEDQLRQAQKMEAIGRMAGGIAHDFNNLLTGINGYTKLALDDLDKDDPLREDLEEIKKAGERAITLTSQLLAFSRKQVLQPKVLDLNILVANLENMLKRVMGEDIELVTLLASELGHVKMDRGQIEQIIVNLAGNARDAMPQGGKLTIKTSNIELKEEYASKNIRIKPGSYVLLVIKDTGVGMNEETLDHIFEPFFTTKDPGKGTGLGLATVFGTVEQSGGKICVESIPGKGSTFTLYFPKLDDPVALESDPFPSEISKGTETVLLVEDEDIVRKFVHRVLSTHGYTVLEAGNPGEALLVYSQHKESIHLLITDVVLPQMSGRKLADRLTQLCPKMKVLYISGYTENDIVHRGVLDKGTQFLQKPMSPEVLLSKLRHVLNLSPKNIN